MRIGLHILDRMTMQGSTEGVPSQYASNQRAAVGVRYPNETRRDVPKIAGTSITLSVVSMFRHILYLGV